ncbi:hypothetical protein HY213_00280 [Candidatus Peregrinibacteria bacterium]|nr:hypothetical protein [Candidatus Peregrinibacteria bacterium]
MRSLLRSCSLLFVLTLMPLTTLAASSQPNQLFAAFNAQKQPVDFTYELHGRYGQSSLSASISGSQQQGASMLEGKASAAMTVDVKTRSTTVHILLHMRILNGTGYIFVDSVSGTFSNDPAHAALTFATKRWIALDLRDGASLQGSDATGMLSALDSILTLQAKSKGTSTIYTLGLQREAAKNALAMLRSMMNSTDMASFGISPLNQPPTVTFTATVTTDAKNHMGSMTVHLTFMNRVVSLTLDGRTTARTSPVSVSVPPNALTLQNMMALWQPMPVSPMMAPMHAPGMIEPAMQPSFDVPAEGDTNAATSTAQNNATDCSTDPSLVRKGLCGPVPLRLRNRSGGKG